MALDPIDAKEGEIKMALTKNFDEMPDFDSNASSKPSKKSNGKLLSWVLLVAIAVVLLVLAFSAKSFFGIDTIAKVSNKDWQAVFLVNGQVYFGKVRTVGKETLTLKDIYYLQVVTKPLQRTQEGATATNQQTQQELTLIKLGNEIHGPTDAMTINQDQILLTEKLKDDSRVVQAINKYLEDQKQK